MNSVCKSKVESRRKIIIEQLFLMAQPSHLWIGSTSVSASGRNIFSSFARRPWHARFSLPECSPLPSSSMDSNSSDAHWPWSIANCKQHVLIVGFFILPLLNMPRDFLDM